MIPRGARAAVLVLSLAIALIPAAAAKDGSASASVAGPDGTWLALPVASATTTQPGVSVAHADSFLREDQLPLILARVGDEVRFRLDYEPAAVRIGYAGHPPESVVRAREFSWSIPTGGSYHVFLLATRNGQAGATTTFEYAARIAAPPTRPANAVLRARAGRFSLRPDVFEWVAPPADSPGTGVEPADAPSAEPRALPRILRLAPNERILISVGFAVTDVRGSGFGRGRLELRSAASGELSWRLSSRRSGRAILRVQDTRGGFLIYSFRYAVAQRG